MSECSCCQNQKDGKKEELLRIIEKYKGNKSSLINVLHEAQEIYGYLPIEVQKTISKRHEYTDG